MTPENKDVAGLLSSSEGVEGLSAEEVASRVRCAFASTNNTPYTGLHMHWYAKGLREGYEAALAAPGAAIAAREQEAPDTDYAEGLIDQCAQDWHDWQKQGNDKDRAAWVASRKTAIEYFSRAFASRQEPPVASGEPAQRMKMVSDALVQLDGLYAGLCDESPERPDWLRTALRVARGEQFGVAVNFASPSGAGLGGAVASSEAVADEQIIARCKSAGINWIAPDLDNDPPSEGGFPGSFDMVTMAEMRNLFAALASQPGCAVEGEAVRRLTADEHEVLRSAVLASSTVVARGRVVEVCPECDIADCRHIRARRTEMSEGAIKGSLTDGKEAL